MQPVFGAVSGRQTNEPASPAGSYVTGAPAARETSRPTYHASGRDTKLRPPSANLAIITSAPDQARTRRHLLRR